jgi:hypothetical protein
MLRHIAVIVILHINLRATYCDAVGGCGAFMWLVHPCGDRTLTS